MVKTEESKRSDILDVALILAKNLKFIIIFTLIVSIFAVIYTLLTPMYWVSTATILPAEKQSNSLPIPSSLLNLGSSLLSGAVNLTSMDFVTILSSRTFSEDVIDKFNLIEYLEVKGKDDLEVRDKAVKLYNETIRKINLNQNTGLIYITIETKDKYLSADIANYLWQRLEEYNLTQKMSKGKQKRIFIEKRIKEVENTIDSLSQMLNDFKIAHNIIDLPAQTNSMIDMYAELISQRLQTDIELEYQQSIYKNDTPLYEHLLHKREVLDNKIQDFETSQQNLNIKYGLNLDDLSDIGLQYGKLMLDLEIQNTLYEFLYPQYENAKIEEIKDLPTIDIVDKAVPAGIRSKPHRAKTCIILFLMALFISSAWVILKTILKQALQKDENRTRISQLKKILIRKNA